ncbi:M9 family metallopeptidase [Sinosporangium album]|nr:M9 family metallopeptidase [Sinosporangium album]
MRRAQTSCEPVDFSGRTGDTLVATIKASTTVCINTLFGLAGADAQGAFQQEQMITVANALRRSALTYPGNNSGSAAQLVLYLRAGYYVQWNLPDLVGEYGVALGAAVRAALDAFFANTRSHDVTDENGEILSEAVTLIDSAQENARYIPVVKRLLNGYNESYNPFWWMLHAVNNVYIVLFRGHQMPDYVRAVESDQSLIQTLYAFASSHMDLLGTDHAYLTGNAGRELGRFLQHQSLLDATRPLVRALLQQSSITGRTAPLWVGIAEMADYYDRGNCAYYQQTCNLQDRLKAAVLPVRHTCDASIRVVAQSITPAELAATCSALHGQVSYFQRLVGATQPVAGDQNSTLEVVVFDSGTDYQTYAGAVYGIDINNGGIYIEGDPASPGNQARFIAFEADWLRPTFEIWNLNHEFTHYLDGRYNMHGDFEASLTTPTVWWTEGVAEYVSYSYRKVPYEEAAAEAGQRTYRLSTLFDTTYSNDPVRVYRWGYLAVRFMFQSRRSDLDSVLTSFRGGDWYAARVRVGAMRQDDTWNSWLGVCAAGACLTTDPPECTGSDVRALDRDCRRSNLSAPAKQYVNLYIKVPVGTTQLKVSASGGSGDADLYINTGTWAKENAYTAKSSTPGNNETLTVNNPKAGYHYISLYARSAFSGVGVTTEY